jgi:hypothetical protein
LASRSFWADLLLHSCCVIWRVAAQGGGEDEEGDDDGDGEFLTQAHQAVVVQHPRYSVQLLSTAKQ